MIILTFPYSGAVVSGVLGSLTPRFSLFGDAMNTASRMETNGSVDMIHISEATARLLLQSGEFVIKERGTSSVKGKGKMKTFWLDGLSEDNRLFQSLSTIKSADNKIESHVYVKRVLVVYRSNVVRKMLIYKLENVSHMVFSTKNTSLGNMLSMVEEHNIDVILLQAAADSRTVDTQLETNLLEGGYKGVLIFISATNNESPSSNWNIVIPVDTVQLNSIINMITSNNPVITYNTNALHARVSPTA